MRELEAASTEFWTDIRLGFLRSHAMRRVRRKRVEAITLDDLRLEVGVTLVLLAHEAG